MELVGAALEHAHHTAAVDITVVGRRVGGENLDLLQRLRRRAVGDEVVEGLVDIDAVQRIVVGLSAVAIQVDRVGVEGAPLNDSGARCAAVLTAPGT